MKISNERRIYVIVAGTVQVPVALIHHNGHVHADTRKGVRTVIQPVGRQVAQACHAVSKLRHKAVHADIVRVQDETLALTRAFEPVTTIVLQARDSAEMLHVYYMLSRKKLNPVIFSDTNPEYGDGFDAPTAVAVFGSPKQVRYILDYLPLWGAK